MQNDLAHQDNDLCALGIRYTLATLSSMTTRRCAVSLRVPHPVTGSCASPRVVPHPLTLKSTRCSLTLLIGIPIRLVVGGRRKRSEGEREAEGGRWNGKLSYRHSIGKIVINVYIFQLMYAIFFRNHTWPEAGGSAQLDCVASPLASSVAGPALRIVIKRISCISPSASQINRQSGLSQFVVAWACSRRIRARQLDRQRRPHAGTHVTHDPGRRQHSWPSLCPIRARARTHGVAARCLSAPHLKVIALCLLSSLQSCHGLDAWRHTCRTPSPIFLERPIVSSSSSMRNRSAAEFALPQRHRQRCCCCWRATLSKALSVLGVLPARVLHAVKIVPAAEGVAASAVVVAAAQPRVKM